MKKETDWFGLWYKILKERGENDRPTLGKLNLKTNVVEWLEFSHSEMDGIGALKKYYDQKKFPLLNLPELREKKLPAFFERLIIFAKILFKKKNLKTIWRENNPGLRPENPQNICWKIFSIEETKAIENYCRGQGLSQNAFLLNITSKILLQELSLNGGGTWTIPVNLRPVLQRLDFYSNHSSGILISIAKDDEVKTTQQNLKKALKNKEHWAIWWVHQMGMVVGLRGMRFLSKRSSTKNFLAGSFSNLGHWQIAPDEIWIGSPPGSPNFPISIMVMQANDQLSFSLKVHSSILSDQNRTQELLDIWSSQLLGVVAIS